jgi:hypothetical protein
VEGMESHSFMERVQSLFLVDFKNLLNGKFIIKNVFGDYQLNSFDEEESDRLIIIAERI